MLIYYGGVNDLVVRERLSNDCYRGLNPQRGLNGTRGQFVERNAELPASALYRLIAILSGWMSNPLSLDSSFEPSRVECDPDPGATTLEMRGVTSMASLARAVASAVYLSVMSPSSTASVTTGGGPPPKRAMLLAVSSPPQPASSSASAANPPGAVAALSRAADVGRERDMVRGNNSGCPPKRI